MRTFAKSRIRYSKSQRLGIFALMLLLVSLQIYDWAFSSPKDSETDFEIPPEVLSIYSPETSSNYSTENSTSEPVLNSNFNPNELSEEGWRNLGFSEKQVQTILKYKYSLGGNFSTKEEIQSCFVISEKKFAEIEPFIQFGSSKSSSSSNYSYSSNSTNHYSNSHSHSKPKINYKPFDPNTFTSQDWQNIGFSEKQANSILKYKHSLGGEFTSLKEIKSAYVVSEEKFQEMKSYIVFKNKSVSVKENFKEEIKTVSIAKEKFNPNKLNHEEWMALGFSDKQAGTILKYKYSLGGDFPDAQTLSKCFVISEEKFKELEPYLDFNK